MLVQIIIIVVFIYCFAFRSALTGTDTAPPVATLKRQQFASLRCTTSYSSDDGNVIEFTPLAPLARLDSLHEMVRISNH